MKKSKALPTAIYVAWSITLAATLASVYFIEILGNPAAALCWFNRMLVLGLLLVLTVAILVRDTKVWRYSIPFLALGLPVSLFQQLVHWDVIKLAETTCSNAAVCTTKYFDLFGFVSQATLCFAAFAGVAICMWMLSRNRDMSK